MAGSKRPLRILGLADLHDRIDMLGKLKGIDVDFIIFCGDLHNGGSKETARPAALFLASLGPPVLIVPGNMDHRDVVHDLWDEAGLQMIHCSSYRWADLGFLGMGGMVARDPRRLGDPSRYYHDDSEVYETLASAYQDIIDARVKIIIVHQPPRGVQDTLYNGESSGSIGLCRFVEEYQPDLLLCGHIHEARGMGFIGTSRIVNVGELRMGRGAIIEIGDDIVVSWVQI
ncbi:MAG: Calcineurin-like phosphoesterase [Methanosaeta sp. PtaU1.Bin112]|nr:MAG: Calcineurin-like phosphoesterase [Methanosaeta sp. PtaU1.Bin112]